MGRHPAEEDLQRWSHHHGVTTVNDEVLRSSGEGFVSFVFGLEVEGKDLALFAQEDEEKKRAAAAAKAAVPPGTSSFGHIARWHVSFGGGG